MSKCELNNVFNVLKNNKENTVINDLEYDKYCFNNRCYVLASAFALKYNTLVQIILEQGKCKLTEILKTCFILDTERYVAQLNKRKKLLIKQKYKTNDKKLKNLDNYIKHNSEFLEQNMNKKNGFALTNAKIKKFKKYWINNLSKTKLKEYTLTIKPNQWKRLINILHLSEKDFSLDWFLPFIFDKDKAPKDSIVREYHDLGFNEEKTLAFIKKHNISYECIRNCELSLNNASYKYICNNCSIDTYLWYWEELSNLEYDNNFASKVNNITFEYGKLMERILCVYEAKSEYFYYALINKAEKMISNMKINCDANIAVLGDASASMQVAINTSCIIASSLSVLCNAQLRLFKSEDIKVEPPKTARDVIKMTEIYKAENATAPASSLYYYYKNKISIDLFVIVTDEEENCDHTGEWYGNGFKFSSLFKKYLNEINENAKLIFISFTKPTCDGYMVEELKKEIPEINNNLYVFKMCSNRPDLSKINKIINHIKLMYVKEKTDIDNNGKILIYL